jgi:hypothetical protein
VLFSSSRRHVRSFLIPNGLCSKITGFGNETGRHGAKTFPHYHERLFRFVTNPDGILTVLSLSLVCLCSLCAATIKI